MEQITIFFVELRMKLKG